MDSGCDVNLDDSDLSDEVDDFVFPVPFSHTVATAVAAVDYRRQPSNFVHATPRSILKRTSEFILSTTVIFAFFCTSVPPQVDWSFFAFWECLSYYPQSESDVVHMTSLQQRAINGTRVITVPVP